jgi:hypothetical protein
MKEEDDYIDWEKEAPHLFAISNENAFKVPEGYFNGLNSQILSQITLADIKKEPIFEVPENYFNQLESQILSQIKIDQFINKNDGFKVSENYFEESQQTIKSSTLSLKKSGKIIHLNFIRYAAAACVLLMTSVGIYVNINRQQNVSYQLSKLPDEAIENYLLIHTDVNDLSIIIDNLGNKSIFPLNQDQLTNDQIKNYLEYTP